MKSDSKKLKRYWKSGKYKKRVRKSHIAVEVMKRREANPGMMNSLAAYRESGRKAGRAMRPQRDISLYNSERNWKTRAITYESSQEDKNAARQAWDEGYKEESYRGHSNPRRFFVKKIGNAYGQKFGVIDMESGATIFVSETQEEAERYMVNLGEGKQMSFDLPGVAKKGQQDMFNPKIDPHSGVWQKEESASDSPFSVMKEYSAKATGLKEDNHAPSYTEWFFRIGNMKHSLVYKPIDYSAQRPAVWVIYRENPSPARIRAVAKRYKGAADSLSGMGYSRAKLLLQKQARRFTGKAAQEERRYGNPRDFYFVVVFKASDLHDILGPFTEKQAQRKWNAEAKPGREAHMVKAQDKMDAFRQAKKYRAYSERKRNPCGYRENLGGYKDASGKFHPIRGSKGYDDDIASGMDYPTYAAKHEKRLAKKEYQGLGHHEKVAHMKEKHEMEQASRGGRGRKYKAGYGYEKNPGGNLPPGYVIYQVFYSAAEATQGAAAAREQYTDETRVRVFRETSTQRYPETTWTVAVKVETKKNPGMKRTLDFKGYAAQAKGMSDPEIHYALLDIKKTLPSADSLDRDEGTDWRGGYYRDQASVLRSEMIFRRQGGRRNPGGHGYRYHPSSTGLYMLSRDDKRIMTGSEQAIWKYLHQTHSYSVEHALRHEGYKIAPIDSSTASNPAGWGAGKDYQSRGPIKTVAELKRVARGILECVEPVSMMASAANLALRSPDYFMARPEKQNELIDIHKRYTFPCRKRNPAGPYERRAVAYASAFYDYLHRGGVKPDFKFFMIPLSLAMQVENNLRISNPYKALGFKYPTSKPEDKYFKTERAANRYASEQAQVYPRPPIYKISERQYLAAKQRKKNPPIESQYAEIYGNLEEIDTDRGTFKPRRKTRIMGDKRDRTRLLLLGDACTKELVGARVLEIRATENRTPGNKPGGKWRHPFGSGAYISPDKKNRIVIKGSRNLWTPRG